MFKVGDEVRLIRSSVITKEGDVGVVVRCNAFSSTIKFSSMHREEYLRETFEIPHSWMELKGPQVGLVERKIKAMYERQSYFLRHISK